MTEAGQNYADIINLSRPVSPKHPTMSMPNRAAPFSPFAALTGYDAAVKETARLTDEKIALDEYAKSMLSDRLQMIAEHGRSSTPIRLCVIHPSVLLKIYAVKGG